VRDDRLAYCWAVAPPQHLVFGDEVLLELVAEKLPIPNLEDEDSLVISRQKTFNMTWPVTEFVAGMIVLEHTNLASAGCTRSICGSTVRIFETPTSLTSPARGIEVPDILLNQVGCQTPTFLYVGRTDRRLLT
jgi:hypothetical protein